MARYNLEALVQRFDTKSDTANTGRISSAFGEILMLDLLADALNFQGLGPVTLLAGKPHRDPTQLAVDAVKPAQRDLDAWIQLGSGQLAAVECKHWTSASLGGVPVPYEDDEVAAMAMRQWGRTKRADFTGQAWTGVNKIALPLKVPAGYEVKDLDLVCRILAFWFPISDQGLSPWSMFEWTPSWRKDPFSIRVFSGSLYVRSLLRDGQTSLTGQFAETGKLLSAIRAIVDDE